MKATFEFILNSLMNGTILYIFSLIMNTLLKISTGKNQEEPNLLFAIVVGFIIHTIYILIK